MTRYQSQEVLPLKIQAYYLYTKSMRFLADTITVPQLQGIEAKKTAALLSELSLGIKCTGMEKR